MINNKKKNNNSKEQLFLVTRKALPKVLINVLEVKELIEEKKYMVSNATKEIGISRTTYYKYCNEVSYYDVAPHNKTVNIDILVTDKVGNLSNITEIISKNKFNILTINQNEPVDNLSQITISVIMTDSNCNISKLVKELKENESIKKIKISSINK